VIGHPETDSPAYGWTEGIKRVGEVLYAKGKEVVSEFEDMVKQGLFKRRSVRLSPDGTKLRHVGFLGAAAPAVKGLKNIAFGDEKETITIEFSETDSWLLDTVARTFRSLRDWLIEKEGKETADAIIPDWDVEHIKEEVQRFKGSEVKTVEPGTMNPEPKKREVQIMGMKDSIKSLLGSLGIDMSKVPDDALPDDVSPKSFSEAEVKAKEKAAAKKAKENAESEFAEKEKENAKKAREKELSDWVEQRVKESILLPAWADSGLTMFMQGLDADTEIEFSEGDEKKNGLKWFQDFLESFGKSPIFKEIAKKGSESADFQEAEKDQETGESIAAKVN